MPSILVSRSSLIYQSHRRRFSTWLPTYNKDPGPLRLLWALLRIEVVLLVVVVVVVLVEIAEGDPPIISETLAVRRRDQIFQLTPGARSI
jgi:hypothetical protein